uniref:cytochrome c oxidase subunit II n=1 Tax=Discus perspectivus TaxID=697275 RepID=UPI002176D4EE|nr:cytochrome c oxidase subunit II [Discus perspectivus]UUB71741.1 cytochrome c oxidase subunit II [Discus perspectivus]
MAFFNEWNLLSPASFVQAEMIFFHDHALVLLVGILGLVFLMGVKLILNTFSSRFLIEAQMLETVWTIVPAILLVWLALPSLRLLYLLDEQGGQSNILKAVGHQWFWSYEAPSLGHLSFDSYMVPQNDLTFGMYRLLEVDNRPMIPVGFPTQVVVTSTDVIHAWAVPALGVKVDAVPGRLNNLNIHPFSTGVYYGQCSEICGANHSFMPISLEVVQTNDM